MGPCPYCAEQVGAEARICRFCNRSLLYSIVVSASMDEKQKHEFFRLWNSIDNKLYKHLPLTSYSQARKDLEKVPLTLAWDLNLFSADVLERKFGHLGIEKRLQGGLPTSADPHLGTDKHNPFVNLLYMGVGLGLIAVTIYGAFFFAPKDQNRDPMQISNGEFPQNSPQQQQIVQIPQAPAPSPSESYPQPQALPSERQLTRNDVDKLLSSTVFIRGGNVLGSGFVISNDGYILSNAHVTRTMDQPTVSFRDGRSFTARKIREDPNYDISLIKIDGGPFNYFELGDANEVFAGEPVITIGNPGGLSFTITRGIVSYNGRIIDNVPYIQTDAAINPGNSGGPMINSNLQVIGINTLTASHEQGISFSLPINLACDLNGIAQSSIARTCPSYSISSDSNISARLDQPRGSNQEDSYAAEARELFDQYQNEKAELSKRYDELKLQNQEIKNELAKDPYNNSLKERLDLKNQEIVAKAQNIEREIKEADLKYINKTLIILERQLVDSRYSAYRSQIQAQIDKAREDQKRIMDLIAAR